MEERTIDQLLIELNIYKNENVVLKKQIFEDLEKVQKANDIIDTFEKIDLLGSREAKNAFIEKEIYEIKGEEFFNSKYFNKYGKDINYTFNEEDLTIFSGNKKLATIYDDRFFHFLEKILSIAYHIFDYYTKSALFLNAQNIISRLKGSMNE
jgi:hypothetical protein